MPQRHQFENKFTGDSRNKTRRAKVVVVANSKQKVFSWTQLVVKYTPKNFGYDYTLYCKQHRNYTEVQRRLNSLPHTLWCRKRAT